MTTTNLPLKIRDGRLPKGAIFSDDRKYRYALWRIWNYDRPRLMQIGLNPSTANELIDDPTITRGTRRAYNAGFGGFLMANLYGFVSTDPRVLLNEEDFVGELNDEYLRQMILMSTVQLCAWGSFSPVAKRAPVVYKMLPNPFCLDVNADGEPRHPLYTDYSVEMRTYCRRT